MDGFLFALTLVAALGCGLNAGFLFAFSAVVMKSLARLQPAQGIAAMQSINVAAVTPAFMTIFFGTAVACAAAIVAGLIALDESYAPWLLAGGALYLVGSVGLTMAYHVPRNEALASVEPHDPDAESHWARYLAEWTRWNHVRAATALAAAASLTIALNVG